MRSLKERDFDGFQRAITDECEAVGQASDAINGALGIEKRDSAADESGPGSTDPSVEAEHVRLFDQMKALEREHRQLEKRPHDVPRHREHRARLHAHITELKAHLER